MKRVKGEALTVAIIAITIISKIIQFCFLPSKYFYDANFIMRTMNGQIVPDKSFQYTAKFYKIINVFGLSTITAWGLLLTVVAVTVICAYLLKKRQSYSIGDSFVILLMVILLNIYAFTLSKEMIQILFFVIAAIVIRKTKNAKKATIILVILFLLESIVFRSYYVLLAELIVIISYVFKLQKNNSSKIVFFRNLVIGITVFVVSIFIVSRVSMDSYDSIMNARYGVNISRQTSLDARTIINDPLGRNTNFAIFLGNYVINIIRLLFPIELATKGAIYVLFIIYQGLLDYSIVNKIAKERSDSKMFLGITLIISFVVMSAIFEPDFGSFARHESCLLPIFMIMKGKNER